MQALYEIIQLQKGRRDIQTAEQTQLDSLIGDTNRCLVLQNQRANMTMAALLWKLEGRGGILSFAKFLILQYPGAKKGLMF